MNTFSRLMKAKLYISSFDLRDPFFIFLNVNQWAKLKKAIKSLIFVVSTWSLAHFSQNDSLQNDKGNPILDYSFICFPFQFHIKVISRSLNFLHMELRNCLLSICKSFPMKITAFYGLNLYFSYCWQCFHYFWIQHFYPEHIEHEMPKISGFHTCD